MNSKKGFQETIARICVCSLGVTWLNMIQRTDVLLKKLIFIHIYGADALTQRHTQHTTKTKRTIKKTHSNSVLCKWPKWFHLHICQMIFCAHFINPRKMKCRKKKSQTTHQNADWNLFSHTNHMIPKHLLLVFFLFISKTSFFSFLFVFYDGNYFDKFHFSTYIHCMLEQWITNTNFPHEFAVKKNVFFFLVFFFFQE